MARRHGDFTPLKPLNSDTKSNPTYRDRRFTGTARIVQRGLQHTYLLKVTDSETGKVVLEKQVKLNPDGGIDRAIGQAHDLAIEFKPKVFRSKKSEFSRFFENFLKYDELVN